MIRFGLVALLLAGGVVRLVTVESPAREQKVERVAPSGPCQLGTYCG